jgi:hypothetical protein
MDYKPGDIFVGIIDFFAILLPGALLSFVYAGLAKDYVFGKALPEIPLDKGIVVATIFVVSAYVLGHFAFYLGSLLDDFFYDPMRRMFFKQDDPLLQSAIRIKESLLNEETSHLVTQQALNKMENDLLSVQVVWERRSATWWKFKSRIRKIIKPLYVWRVSNDEVKALALLEPLKKNKVQGQGELLEDTIGYLMANEPLPVAAREMKNKFLYDLGVISPPDGVAMKQKEYDFKKSLLKNTAIQIMNTFQWAKAYVELKAPGTAVEIHRYEANSKFFRSLIIVLIAIIPMVFGNSLFHYKSPAAAWLFSLLIVVFIFGGCLIYVDQRRKAIRAAYQYFIVLVKTEARAPTIIARK